VADLNRNDLKNLARLGAKARLEELRQEEAAIRRAFPELFSKGAAAAPAAKAGGRRRRRRRMSAAARKAVSDRMTKYWAERRKSKGKGKGKS
jgi:hypothetical protein